MGLCRGDVDPQVCRTCLNDCSYLLRQRCRDKKEAVGGYDNCTLRYSNHSILGVMETKYIYYLLNANNVSSNSVDAFFQDLGTLFDALKDRAASGDSLRKFATGNASASDFLTLYALVQCSPDLSQRDCSNCLDYMFISLPSGKIGGRVVGPSCNVRYEVYLFYGSAYTPLRASPPQLAPPSSNRTTSTQGKESKTSTTVIVAIVSSIVVSVILLIISACVYLRRKKKNDAETLQLFQHVEEIESLESLQYSFDTIRVGTDNFSEENKLGQGGFGSVYRGRLPMDNK